MSPSFIPRRRFSRPAVALIATALSVASLAVVVAAAPSASADTAGQLSIGDTAVVKPTTGTADMTFRIKLLQPSHNLVKVHYATSDGSAISGRDYQYTAGVSSFQPGAQTATVTVPVLSNTIATGNRYFYVNLDDAAYATIVDGSGSGTILDANPQPSLSVDDTASVVGYNGTGTMTYNVTLSEASPNTVSVRYRTNNNNARAGLQYTYENGTVTFAPGETSKMVTVPLLGHVPAEQRWYFNLQLFGAVNAGIADDTAYGYITDNDRYGYLTVDDTVVTKPASGTKVVDVPVRLVSPTTYPVTVDYYTQNDSAIAGTDYTPTTGTVTFPAGTTDQTVPVTVTGNSANNAPRGFYVQMTDYSTSATPLRLGYGYVTIQSTGSPVTTLSVKDAAVVKPTSGSTNVVLSVTASPKSATPITFNYTTNDGSAIAGTDYTAKSGIATIPANAASVNISVPVAGNNSVQGDLGFYLDISANSSGTIRRSRGEGAILPAAPSQQGGFVSVDNRVGIKPTSSPSTFQVPVTLAPSSAVPVTVNYSTFDNSAIAGTDYTSATGTLTFAPGDTIKYVPVTLLPSTLSGGTKYFGLSISSPTNATINTATAYQAIVNRNVAPVITVLDSAVYRPLSGNASMRFTVRLSAPSVNAVTFDYNASDGSAVAGTGYVATSGSATIPAGKLSTVVSVPVIGSPTTTVQQYFRLNIANIANASPATTTAYGYVLNDVVTPYVSVVDTLAVVGATDTTATFQFTLSAPSANTVSVDYSTSNGSALAGTDYTAKAGTVTFNPGQTSKTVAVTVTGNAVRTGGLYFYIGLGNAQNAVFGSHQTAVAQLDYSAVTPRLSIGDVAVTRQTTGTKNASFTVTLTPASAGTVTVNYNTSDGTANAGTDYTSTSGTLSFAPGDTSKTVNVPIVASAASTPDRYFYLSLGSPVNAAVLRSYAYGEIVDAVAPTSGLSYASITDSTVIAPSSGTANESFTVTLQPASTSTVQLSYYTSDNDAVAGQDYTSQQGTLTFAPGQTSKTITVPVNAQAVSRGDSSFYVNLRLPSGPVSFQRSSALGVIINAVAGSELNVGGDVSIVRGASEPGTPNTVAFTVNLTPAQTVPVKVDFHTEDDSAIAGRDYDQTQGTLTFAPGVTSLTVPVTVHASSKASGNPDFRLVLDNPINSGLPDGYANRSYAYLDGTDTFDITGVVTDPSGAGVAGVTVTRTGNNQPALAVTTAADGSFDIPNSTEGKYTVTPSGAGQTYLPASLSATVSSVLGSSQTDRAFIAYTGQVIRGQVSDSTGANLGGVTLTRTGNAQPTATAVSNVRGYFVIPTPVDGTYTLKPTLTGSTFTPVTRSVVLSGASSTLQLFAQN